MRLSLLTLLAVLVYSVQAHYQMYDGIEAEFEAHYVVVRRQLDAAWRWTGMFELVDVLINHLCDEFPELLPATNKEMSKLKDQTFNLLVHTDGYSELPAYEWDQKLVARLPKYSLVDAKVKQLRKVAKLYFSKLSEDEKKEKYANEDEFILYHLEEPVRQLIQAKVESYQERGLTNKQIEKEILKKDAAVSKAWKADENEGKKETADEDDMFESEYSFEALFMVAKRDLDGALQYAGMFEIVDVLINDVCDEFPELIPATDKEMIELKSQTFDLLVQTKPHTGKGTRVWEKHLEEKLPKYSLLAAKFNQLRKLCKRAFAQLSEADKKNFRNEIVFLNYHLEKPVKKLLQAKMESYEARGFTRKQIEKEIAKKDDEVHQVWRNLREETLHGFDHLEL